MIPYGNIGAVDFFPGVSLRSTTRLNADDALRATCRPQSRAVFQQPAHNRGFFCFSSTIETPYTAFLLDLSIINIGGGNLLLFCLFLPNLIRI